MIFHASFHLILCSCEIIISLLEVRTLRSEGLVTSHMRESDFTLSYIRLPYSIVNLLLSFSQLQSQGKDSFFYFILSPQFKVMCQHHETDHTDVQMWFQRNGTHRGDIRLQAEQ